MKDKATYLKIIRDSPICLETTDRNEIFLRNMTVIRFFEFQALKKNFIQIPNL